MNDRQKVTWIAIFVTLILLAFWWLAAQFVPILKTEIAFATGLPIVIAIAVLAPIVRGIRK